MGRLPRPVRLGLLGGAGLVYLTFVGLLTKFVDREVNLVGDQITIALVLLLFPAALVGWLAAGAQVVAGRRVEPRLGGSAAAGLIAGAVTGALGGATAVAIDLIGPARVREIFLPITPELVAFMTFDVTPVVLGALVLVFVSAVIGSMAAVLRTLPDLPRKPIMTAIWSVLLFGGLQRIVPNTLDALDIERDWLYSDISGGLTWVGAAVVGVVAAGVSVLKVLRGGAIRKRFAPTSGGRPSPARIGALVGVVVLILVAPPLVGKDLSQVLGLVGVFALLALGLNIVVGYAGMLHLGFVFFLAFGAYTTALLTGATLNIFTGSTEPAFAANLNFYLALPVVMLLAAGVSVLIGAPVLRLRGDYLALVTLAIGETITVLAASPWLEPLVGGPAGMRDITDAGFAGISFRDPTNFVYLALAFVIVAVFVSWRLVNSRIGRGWTAMREDEQIAEAMGVSIVRYKLLAFAVGGAIGAMGGALFAVKIGSLTPASFEVIVSIQVLGIVILGGMGSLPGVIVGALVLVGLPGLLREFEEYRLLVYGAALVAIMLLRPQGLVPNVRRTRELQEDEKAQDSWQQIFESPEDAGGTSTEGATT
jgi:branched-chain amino acid transport system permease protein